MQYVILRKCGGSYKFLTNNTFFDSSLLNARFFTDYDEALKIYQNMMKYRGGDEKYFLIKRPKYAFTKVGDRWYYSQFRTSINERVQALISLGDKKIITEHSDYIG